jgi:SAM-dependent methyltransferase
MNDGHGSVEQIAREYDEFYTQGDFVHYSRRKSTRVLRAMMKKAGVCPSARVLDLGCGTGYYSSILADLGFSVVGVDISVKAIEQAKKRNTKYDFRVSDAWKFQCEPGSFDCIVLSGCSILNTGDLQLIRDFLENILRHIPQGGKIVIAQSSNFSGVRSSPETFFNHTWRQMHEYLPRHHGVLRTFSLSHFRIISFLGVYGLSRLITLCLRPGFLRIQRYTFQVIVKV